MSNVLVDKYKIDILANAIANKSGEAVTMTLSDMVQAVDGIETGGGEPNLQSKTYTVDSAGTETITADSGYDGLSEVEVTVPQGEIYVENYKGFYTASGARKWHCQAHAVIETGDSYGTPGFIADHTSVRGTDNVYNAIPTGTTVTPTTSSQTIGGADTMMEGAVTVNPIPSQYKDTTDATATADKILSGYTAYAGGQKLTGTASGGGGKPVLLNTQSIGTVSTTSTSAITVGSQFQTSITGYNYFFIVTSADMSEASTHAATVALWVRLQGGSKQFLPYINYGFNANGVIVEKSFPSGTQAYGIYPSISSSANTLTITMKAVYNATYTGTIDNDYTVRVYGVKNSDILSL